MSKPQYYACIHGYIKGRRIFSLVHLSIILFLYLFYYHQRLISFVSSVATLLTLPVILNRDIPTLQNGCITDSLSVLTANSPRAIIYKQYPIYLYASAITLYSTIPTMAPLIAPHLVPPSILQPRWYYYDSPSLSTGARSAIITISVLIFILFVIACVRRAKYGRFGRIPPHLQPQYQYPNAYGRPIPLPTSNLTSQHWPKPAGNAQDIPPSYSEPGTLYTPPATYGGHSDHGASGVTHPATVHGSEH